MAILFVSGVQVEVWKIGVEMQLADGQGSKFPFSQSGQDQRFVDQGTFSPQAFQVRFGFASEFGVGFAFSVALADGLRFELWPTASHAEQLHQFGFGHRSTDTLAVCLYVRLRDLLEWVRDKPIRRDAPVAERHQIIPIAVPRSRPGPVIDQLDQPTLERFMGEIFQAYVAAFRLDAFEMLFRVLPMRRRQPTPPHMFSVGVEMILQRRPKMIGGGVFACRHHPALDQFGAAFQVSENRTGGLLITTAGRYFAHNPAPVAILGGVRLRFDDDARLAVLARRHQRLAYLPFRVFPSSELLTFAGKQFGPGGQWLREGFLVDGSHVSYPFSSL